LNNPADERRNKVARLILLAILIFSIATFAACFSGEGNPESDDSDPPVENDDDDDASGNDDDSDDDDSSDDDDDDTGDDDDDDDTVEPVDCDTLVGRIYDDCGLTLTDGLGDRPSKTEALALCNAGSPFWPCARDCSDDQADCTDFANCVNGTCPGQYNLIAAQ
jgi:hypothetical protein